MTEEVKDPEIKQWIALWEERKKMHKLESKEKAKPLTLNKVSGSLTEKEVRFLKASPNYGALAESAMETLDLVCFLYSKSRENTVRFNKIYKAADIMAKKAVEDIIKRS